MRESGVEQREDTHAVRAVQCGATVIDGREVSAWPPRPLQRLPESTAITRDNWRASATQSQDSLTPQASLLAWLVSNSPLVAHEVSTHMLTLSRSGKPAADYEYLHFGCVPGKLQCTIFDTQI